MVTRPRQNISVYSIVLRYGIAVVLLFGYLDSHAQKTKDVAGYNMQQLLSQPERISILIAKGQIEASQIPNPHWQQRGCIACHKNKAKKGKLNLRSSNINQLCSNCHNLFISHDIIHPVDITPSAAMKKRMPSSFKVSLARGAGRVTCINCHELPMQCTPARFREKGLNPHFLRMGPYSDRTKLCYNCHDSKKYQRLNPHDHIRESGEKRDDLCLVCHSDTKELKDARGIDQVSFNVKDDLSHMCTGCHLWQPHPGGAGSLVGKEGPNHLVRPSSWVLKRLKQMQEKHAVVFPLEPETDRLFCGTCHNPHKKGVVNTVEAEKGAGAEKRLRVPEKEICSFCHEM